MTVATATGLVATVDVAHEGSAKRIGPRTDAADLRVWTGTPLRLALVVGRENADRAAASAAALGACADIVLTLPAEATSQGKIIQLVETPTSTAQDLHKVISNDPALCSRILKVVNSAFYGLPGQIGSINPGQVGQVALRRLEFVGDNRVILKPPPALIDGKLVQGYVNWERVTPPVKSTQ